MNNSLSFDIFICNPKKSITPSEFKFFDGLDFTSEKGYTLNDEKMMEKKLDEYIGSGLVNVIDSNGRTILHYLCENQMPRLCEKVMNLMNPELYNVIDKESSTAIMLIYSAGKGVDDRYEDCDFDYKLMDMIAIILVENMNLQALSHTNSKVGSGLCCMLWGRSSDVARKILSYPIQLVLGQFRTDELWMANECDEDIKELIFNKMTKKELINYIDDIYHNKMEYLS